MARKKVVKPNKSRVQKLIEFIRDAFREHDEGPYEGDQVEYVGKRYGTGLIVEYNADDGIYVCVERICDCPDSLQELVDSMKEFIDDYEKARFLMTNKSPLPNEPAKKE